MRPRLKLTSVVRLSDVGTVPLSITEGEKRVVKLSTSPVSQGISDALKSFMCKDEVVEKYISSNELSILLQLIWSIGQEARAFLVTHDPFDNYEVSVQTFDDIILSACKMIKYPGDIRIFGDRWAVGISSYNASSGGDESETLALDEIEMKISLVGRASAWLET